MSGLRDSIGFQNAWPMSLLVQAMTSEDDDEILECLHLVRNSSRLGLVHESINVDQITEYTSMAPHLFISILLHPPVFHRPVVQSSSLPSSSRSILPFSLPPFLPSSLPPLTHSPSITYPPSSLL